jgi:ABC-type transporter Mla subunit MlaD
MSASANYYKVGIFVIMALIIAVIAIVVLGADTLLQQRIVVETYIDQSVQGLDIGSAVRYRGVQVGNIKAIDFVYNHYSEARESGLRHVLIRMNIDPKPFGLDKARKLLYDALRPEIEKGLRVRMRPQGITGAFYLELDYGDPARSEYYKPEWAPDHPYIPSAQSAISRIGESVERILAKIERMEVEKLVDNLNETLTALKSELDGARLSKLHDEASTLLQTATRQVEAVRMESLHSKVAAVVDDIHKSNAMLQDILGGPEIKAILADGKGSVEGARRLVEGEQLKTIMDNLAQASKNLSEASEKIDGIAGSEDLTAALVHFRNTLGRLDRLVSGQQRNVEDIVENLARTALDLKELIQEARKYPSGFLFGEPPDPSRKGSK